MHNGPAVKSVCILEQSRRSYLETRHDAEKEGSETQPRGDGPQCTKKYGARGKGGQPDEYHREWLKECRFAEVREARGLVLEGARQGLKLDEA